MNPALAKDLLNSLTAHIAVMDAHGSIIAVNDAWKNFARESGSRDESFYVGVNYLDICEHAVGLGGDGDAIAVLQGLRALLRGESTHFSVEYPCHSPTEKRWFIVRIARFQHEGETYFGAAHENITAQKLAQIQLLESEATLRGVLEALPVGVWIMNRQGTIVHGNPAGLKIWGGARYVGPEQFGQYKGWWLDTGKPIAADEWAAARAIRDGETTIDEEIRIECFDGSGKIILNSGSPLRDDDGNIAGAIIVNQDITSRKRGEEDFLKAGAALESANRELEQVLASEQAKARTDQLTGLLNRRHFFELSEPLFASAKRYRTPLSVFVFDVDHFKRVNDVHGHLAGDQILKAIARTVRGNIRDADILARYGGEEFIVILPNTNARDAQVVAEHSRERVAALQEKFGDVELRVTISTGVAELAYDSDTLDHLIHRADQAMYDAKRAGRNCTRLYSSSLPGNAASRDPL